MLRYVVLLLLLLNGGFFVWQQGYVDPWLGSLGMRESNRAHQQINPERLIVQGEKKPMVAAVSLPPVTSESAVNASNLNVAPAAGYAPEGPVLCLEAGPFSDAEAAQVNAVLARSLATGSWRTDRFPVPGLWLIYMGPYPEPGALQAKQDELSRMAAGVSYEEVRSPESLRMGLSLGRYNSEAAANTALQALLPKGVRTARVENVRQPTDVSVVRVQQADQRIQQQLKALPLPPERGFVACLAP